MPVNRNNLKLIELAYYRQLWIDFFHNRLFEILFLEMWTKGDIMRQIKSIMKDSLTSNMAANVCFVLKQPYLRLT